MDRVPIPFIHSATPFDYTIRFHLNGIVWKQQAWGARCGRPVNQLRCALPEMAEMREDLMEGPCSRDEGFASPLHLEVAVASVKACRNWQGT